MEVKFASRPLRVWEAEATVRAAGWIFLLRGCGIAFGGLLGTLARRQCGDGSVCLLQWAAIPSILYVCLGLKVLSRSSDSPWIALPLSLAWFALLASPFAPESLGNDGSWDPFDISRTPTLQMFLPLFFLPDLFALYALLRRGGRASLGAEERPLAALWTAWRVRLTGRVIVSLGMVTLAWLSTAIYLLGVPGVMIAWSYHD